MQNYYLNILGLSAGASKKDIKSAYRRLSKLFHPDVSSDPQAKERFIQITEAYKFLTQVGPRPAGQPKAYDYDPLKEEYRRQRAKARYWARQRAREATKRHYQAVKQFNEFFTYPLMVIVAVNLIFALDFLIPEQDLQFKVEKVTPEYQNKKLENGVTIRLHTYDRIHWENHSIRVKSNRRFNLLAGRNINIKRTAILGRLRQIRAELESGQLIYQHYLALYDFFWFLMPLMIIMATVYYLPLGLEPRMSLGVLIFMCFVVEVCLFWFT